MLKLRKKFGYYDFYLESDTSRTTAHISLNYLTGWEIQLDSGFGQTTTKYRLRREEVVPTLISLLNEEEEGTPPVNAAEIEEVIAHFRIKWVGYAYPKTVFDSSVPTEEAIDAMDKRRVIPIPGYFDTVGEAQDAIEGVEPDENALPYLVSEESCYTIFDELK